MILEKKVEREFESDGIEGNICCPVCGKNIDHLMTHLQRSHNWNPWNDETLTNKIYEKEEGDQHGKL